MEKYLKNSDPRIYEIIKEKNTRQEDHIELIASENVFSRAVLLTDFNYIMIKYNR